MKPAKLAKIVKQFRVEKGVRFRLAGIDPSETAGLKKDDAHVLLDDGAARLIALQEKLYAQGRWAVLAIFQGMDTAGKDGAISHVMAGINPQGCVVHSFKAPSSQELAHDFLWRANACLPERGRIGIFNRSYYEDVLVVRVHRELLALQNLPARLVTPNIWRERYEDICALERHLARSGTIVLKFHLRISKGEQKERLLARIADDSKQWKFNAGDLKERALWNRYMAAYQDVIAHTSAPHAPWYVIPADHKWFARVAVMQAMIDALERLDLALPPISAADRAAMKDARAALEKE